MTDPEEDVLPRWVLATPTRSWEWWFNPALLVLVGVGLAIGSVLVAEPLVIRMAATVAAIAVIVGAVLLAAAGHRAYLEQDREASWSLHVVAVVVGYGSAAIIALLGLATDEPVLAFAAVVSLFSGRLWALPGRPRLDVLVVMVTEAVVGASSLLRAVIGFRAHPTADTSSSAWFLPALLAVAFAVYLVMDRRALRTAPAR